MIDYDLIPHLVAEGVSAKDMAARFGTTVNSLHVQCSKRGISLRDPNKKAQFFIQLPAETRASLSTMAKKIGYDEQWLARRLIEVIARDDLYLAVLDKDVYCRRVEEAA
jgi:hypothetical protein